jgi:hypothetical protein
MTEKPFTDGSGEVWIVPSHLFKVKRNGSGTNIIAVNGEVIATVEEVICDYCNIEVPDLIEAAEGINKFYLPAPLALINGGREAICLKCFKKYYPLQYELQQEGIEDLIKRYKEEMIRQGLIVIKDGREERSTGKH